MAGRFRLVIQCITLGVMLALGRKMMALLCRCRHARRDRSLNQCNGGRRAVYSLNQFFGVHETLVHRPCTALCATR
ncbi:MAG: hypothetical protein ACE5HE_04315 [Phycisphaerae bacterium]